MKKHVSAGRRAERHSQFALAQNCLLDAYGYVPLNVKTDVQLVPSTPGTYGIEKMRFHLNPMPTNLAAAFEKITDVLRLLHIERKRWKYLRPGCIEPIQLDSWKCGSSTVLFRHRRDGNIVHVTYSQGHLELSMPHTALWKESGLEWLAFYTFCCERNAQNPTPWLGPSCGCEKRMRLLSRANARKRAVSSSITTNTHIFCSHD